MEEGRFLAERDQIELLVEILILQLDQVQLGRTAQRVSQQIREVTGQQHNVQTAVMEPSGEAQVEEVANVVRPRPRPFFNTTSFSSCSEGEDEM